MVQSQQDKIREVLWHSFEKKVREEIGNSPWPSFWSDEEIIQVLTEGGLRARGLIIVIRIETQHRDIERSGRLRDLVDENLGGINGLAQMGCRVMIADAQGNDILDHFFGSPRHVSTY